MLHLEKMDKNDTQIAQNNWGPNYFKNEEFQEWWRERLARREGRHGEKRKGFGSLLSEGW